MTDAQKQWRKLGPRGRRDALWALRAALQSEDVWLKRDIESARKNNKRIQAAIDVLEELAK
jgi:hypothetical protein